MYIQQFFIEGLGCASYLIGCEEEGVAAIIDPEREVEPYLETAKARGLKITHIIETHLHADHVSGNTALAAHTGADIYLHSASQATFPHKPLQEGDEIPLGTVRLQVLHTPGHTPESITLLAVDTTRAREPWLALTGDTLFVGDVGRPDLVGKDAAKQLAEQMHDSLFSKLLPLSDSLLIFPGHGAGSLCGKSLKEMRSTTLGFERKYNPAFQPRPREAFVQWDLANLPEQPGNHPHIKALNRRGPVPLGEIQPRPLTVQEAIPYFRRGAVLLDTRPKTDYVVKHVPGSIHLEMDEQLSNRIGFILHPEMPIILLLPSPEMYRQVVLKLARVGYEQVIGYLHESLDVWERYGLPVASGDIRDVEPIELNVLLQADSPARPIVLDVREPWEFRQGHVPGALLIPLGDLAERVEELDPETPVAVICAAGNRSQSAAAILGHHHFKTIYNVLGGTSAWQQAGLPLTRQASTEVINSSQHESELHQRA